MVEQNTIKQITFIKQGLSVLFADIQIVFRASPTSLNG